MQQNLVATGCVTPEVRADRLPSTATPGLRSESSAVWLERGVYERAESQYYLRLQQHQNGTVSTSSSASHGLHGTQEARQHMVQPAWVNTPVFDQAESLSAPPHKQTYSANSPGVLQLLPNSPSSTASYDEGYLSQTPTPRTPTSRPINGLPFLPAPLQGVWLQKPLYDRAEASFYQNLYGQKELHYEAVAASEEHVDSEDVRGTVPQEARPDKAEEEKPHDGAVKKEGGAAWCHFLHADSERVWLDRRLYTEAETRFHEALATKTSQTAVARCSSSLKMTGVDFLAHEKIWLDKRRYDEAERRFYERRNGPSPPAQGSGANSILQDIARARQNIQKSLAGTAGGDSAEQGEILTRVMNLELENQSLHKVVEELRSALSKLESRVSVLEKRPVPHAPTVNGTAPNKAIPAHTAQSTPEEEESDVDLFGSDDEVDEEAERVKEQRLQEYAAKKAKKPVLIAKSSILLDVKPWDDETDMVELEQCVRSVQVDGLLWGASKLVPVGYGIKKLQINCVVEDEKVGTDLLEEEITKFEDYVQSVDVAAFNKI
ncbi:eukaryotic translation elongation factor 1 delta b (guanine nucleotide exchange protein) isoform X2 [Brachyhypopomus gauderio]|uniref:eukaryotic translation elongation factor 1 delta b (guanine nucleotide exchange protein) isoform X2 n=1 Tax=Brachyhypopomus gauderio TaxID=698409 RepID=UPI004043650F